jgi:uncharacterized protein YbjT (DUF2867 family)
VTILLLKGDIVDTKILITGSTGNLGSEVVKRLSSKGFGLRAAVHSKGKVEKVRLPGVDLVEVDYNRPESIGQALTGMNKLFLLTSFVKDTGGDD